MSDEYNVLKERFDAFVRCVVPGLTAEKADRAVQAINGLVSLHRPYDWAFLDEPRVLLGMTSRGEMVVYGEGGRLGFYHVVPYDELHERVSSMVDRARESYTNGKEFLPTPAENATFHRAMAERLNGAERLLAELVSLRQKQESI